MVNSNEILGSTIDLGSIESIIYPITIEDFLNNIKNLNFYHFKKNKPNLTTKFGIGEFENLLWTNESFIPSHLNVYNANNQRISPPRRKENKDLFRWAIDQYIAGSKLQLQKINKMLPVFSKLESVSAISLFSNITIDAILLPLTYQPEFFCLSSKGNVIIVQTKGVTNLKIYNQDQTIKVFNEKSNIHNEINYNEITLSEGDALYINKNQNYEVSVEDSTSIYLIINFTPYTNLDYLKNLIDVVSENHIALRKSIDAMQKENLQTNFNDILIQFTDESHSKRIQLHTINRLWVNLMTKLKPLPGHHLNNAIKVNSLSTNSIISRASEIVKYQYEIGNHIHLFIPGLALIDNREWEPGRLVFPIESFYLLKAIFDMQNDFKLDDLPSIYSAESKYEVVRKLVLEGVLTLK